MTEQWTPEQLKTYLLNKKQPSGRKAGSGSKAKSEIEMILKLFGKPYFAEYAFHPERKWRFDFAIPELKIGIEYEGLLSDKSRHTTVKGYTNDSEKYNAAQMLGWRVLRYTAINYKQLASDLNGIS